MQCEYEESEGRGCMREIREKGCTKKVRGYQEDEDAPVACTVRCTVRTYLLDLLRVLCPHSL